jgi:hypothetical protein
MAAPTQTNLPVEHGEYYITNKERVRDKAIKHCVKNGMFSVNRDGEYFFKLDDIRHFERSIIEYGKVG